MPLGEFYTTITEEVSQKAREVLAKYDFVDVLGNDTLNQFSMERSLGKSGSLAVWGRGSYDPKVSTSLRLGWCGDDFDSVIPLIATNDAALLETVVRHTLTFIATLKECDLRQSATSLRRLSDYAAAD